MEVREEVIFDEIPYAVFPKIKTIVQWKWQIDSRN